MLHAFFCRPGPAAQRRARVASWLAPFALALFAVMAPAEITFSQQLPANLTPDQLQLLQQQFGQQNQGASGNTAVPGQLPQPLILQPAVPSSQSALPPSRLEQIMSARAGMRLQQFGYNQLGSGAPVTVPQTGAVQDDYVLGTGDEIVVSLRGQENNEYRVIVDRNGQITLPRLSPISASGRTFGSLRQDIQAAVRRAYVATDSFVTVARLRQISVLVSGEVNNPGQRLLTGLSSAVDALLLSGGIKKTGSLRAVHILRGGREFTIDLYGLLTDNARDSNFHLADGDRILVPPLGPTVAVAGLVRQPGIYELAPHSAGLTVRNLLDLAGGQVVRGTYRVSLLNVQPDGRLSMVPVSDESSLVRDSEILTVQLAADEVVTQATLVGDSGLAGSYPIQSATRLSDLLRAPGAMGLAPYMLFGILVRKDPITQQPVLSAFTPVAVLSGREDLQLRNGDLVRVMSANEAHLLTYVVQTYLARLAAQQATIRNPLGVSVGETLAGSVASQSGQNTEPVSIGSIPAEMQRQVINQLLVEPAPGSAQALQQADQVAAAQRAAQQNALSQQVGGRDANLPQQISPSSVAMPMAALPATAFPSGAPPAIGAGADLASNFEPARNFTEQVVDPSGFASNREVQNFGQLARQLRLDPLILINFLVDWRISLEGAVRGPGYYFVGPNASLQDVVQAAGGSGNWADEKGVELISTSVDPQSGTQRTERSNLPLRQGLLTSYIVRPRDQIRFAPIFTDVGTGSVTVQGEVRTPGTFAIIRGEHLSDVLARAGGLTITAYPYGTVFLRQSAAQNEREGYVRAASEIQSQLMIAMTRIGNDKIDPNTFASLQTFVTELRNQRALGRISIIADPSVLASNPALDPLLESGDVIYIPPRPATVSVLGQVLQPGSFPYRAGATLEDYIGLAGGYASAADSSQTFIVLPDGTARRLEKSWLRLSANQAFPPGSTVVVPRDVTPLDLRQTIIDVSQIFSQFAIAIASVAVLSKQ